MKCFNCGKEGIEYLCPECRNELVLEKIFKEIRSYRPDTCENPYIAEYAAGLTEKYAERDCIPSILDYFDSTINEFYYCQYYRMRRDDRFEDAVLLYLENHSLDEIKTQNVLYDLIESYIPNNFIKPKKWCEIIYERDDLCCELYLIAAKYFAMIGEYDISDSIAEKTITICESGNAKFLFFSPDGMIYKLTLQKEDTLRYRTKKPYWPSTEERRRAVAMFYDEKGINYPRIENKPVKIPENEFSPINECFDEGFQDYSAFWCSEAFNRSGINGIYEIAAVKIRNGQIIDTFQSLIRPWDGPADRKDAARKAEVPLSVIESAEDVDQVMVKFFEFVSEDILVSTGALGNQLKYITRAARYTGMKEIKNEFFDILDFAADVSADFDLANNTREYLLSHFSMDEGRDSLEKAKLNKQLYDALQNYGD